MSAPYGAREYQYCFRQYKPLAPADKPEHSCRGPENDGDELRRREQPAKHESAIRITTKELQSEASNRIHHRVREDHLAVELLPSAQSHQHEEQREAHDRFVQLHRMQG